jgi:hypothetical protein
MKRQPIKITSFRLGLNLETNRPVTTAEVIIAMLTELKIQIEFEYRQLLPVISRKYEVR